MLKETEKIGIGIMSGTSLDGLDIAACKFQQIDGNYSFDIINAETITYNDNWLSKLTSAPSLSGEMLTQLNVDYGHFVGKHVSKFVNKHHIKADYVASHGHTVFHQPENNFTLQIGAGSSIAITSGLLTVCDFRSNNIALNGQGAPLVPIGDELLFHEYDACLNLGGFANISFRENKERIAYDICPVNIAINHYANQLDQEYDNDGIIARTNNYNDTLLKKLNEIDFYKQLYPKSLGREWLEKVFLKQVDESNISTEEKIATITHHAALKINEAVKKRKTIVTGGGAYNQFLLDLLKKENNQNIIVPNNNLINFKEALIFAFLGLLRIETKVNCLKSATGAIRDNIGGCIYLP